MNELTVQFKRGTFVTNFVEYKAALTEKLLDYKGMAITQDNLSESKESRRELTRGKKVIADARIKYKKKVLEQYTDLEKECNELTEIIEETENELKAKIDVFDEQERQKKRDHALSVYNELKLESIVELKSDHDTVDLDISWYTNVATSLKKITADVTEQFKSCLEKQVTEENNIELVATQIKSTSQLLGLATPITVAEIEAKIDDYATMDVPAVLSFISTLGQSKKAAEDAAILKAEAMAKARAEAKAKAEAEAKALEEARLKAEAEAKALEEARVLAVQKAKEEEKARIKLEEAMKEAFVEPVAEVVEDVYPDFEIDMPDFEIDIDEEEAETFTIEPLETFNVNMQIVTDDVDGLKQTLTNLGYKFKVIDVQEG